MAPEPERNLRLEIGHVLFIDIVGYSKLLIEEQKERLRQLTEIVLATAQVREATNEQLVRLPTGDGMALVFRDSSEEPAQCALEIAQALKAHPEIGVRMGVHSGPVSEVTDVNERTNIAGAGINIAQRVMDCGDAGHILLSKRVAEDLESYRQWAHHLHSLGECEVKHGVRIHLVNFYTDEVGNAQLPVRFRQLAEKKAAPVVSRRDEELWIAVLPFKSAGDADTESFAEGLVEDVTTGLSRFGYLSVVANASDARYVLKGSIRKGGSGIRVIAQLVDTRTGAQLWAETYNRDLQVLTIFDAQEDIAARIVATVADSYGVLVHSMREVSEQKDDADLTPAEWQFQYFAYREQITPAAHGALRSRLERAAKSDNRPSDLWACLAQVYVDEYAFGFPGDDGKSLDRALAAARRGVELDRANQFAMVALAQTHFFRQDLAAFDPAAERAMALNPLNTDALGILGLEIVHTGGFERGTAIVRRAMELNPNHAGWMHFAPLWDHFHNGEYEQALECANRVDVPGLFWPYLVMASAWGHLGRRAEAAAAVRDLLALDPEFATHALSNVATWHFASGLMDPILEGLRKAGLAIPESESSGSPRPSGTVTPKANRAKSGTNAGALRAQEGFWVAVLPFKYSGSNADLTALTEGLTEEIVTGLSRFSYLKVIARSSTARHASESVDVRSAGKELGARYVMEGSLRQAGTKLRLAVQLVDAVSGAHLWAENYERVFSPEAVFELQDELVPRIVSTVADRYGVVSYSISELVRSKSPDQLTSYEAVLRAIGYGYRLSPEEHATARACLERAVQQAPNYADGWAMLSLLYSDEYGFDFNAQPDPLGRALQAARRATDAAPSNSLAQTALARTLFFRKEFQAFRVAAEQAISLNPMDGVQLAMIGSMLAYSGEWDRGCALIERSMQLNPGYPGWYWFPFFYNAYRQRDYRGALTVALKINLPGFFAVYEVLAAVYGQLGERDAASQSLNEMLKLVPNFGEVARTLKSKWFDPEFVENILDGLRKAGLKIDDRPGTSTAVKASEPATARADEGFWVAVLPFKYSGSNSDLTALAEGMTEEIVTGLSHFSYLRVIALGSTGRYANQAVDVRSVGKELGARYVMEGSLRQAGARLRVAVQMIDTASGAHLWAETYDRAFVPEEIFSLQDDLVPRIVSTVADMHGVLPRSMSEVVRLKAADQMSPYEALLRSFGYNERFTPEDLAEVRTCLEGAVRQAPGNAECWAMLSLMYANEYGHWDNAEPDSLDRSLRAARKAVEAAPLHSLPYYALAQALYFKKEFTAFRVAADRAISLNPMDGATAAFMGMLIAYSGDWERGCALSDKGCQLNPNHPGWYCYPAWHDSYRKKDYRKALDLAFQLNAPQNYYTHAVLAMCYAQLGRMEEARKALRDMLALKPNYAGVARELHGRWIEPDLVEQLMDGLRKAGLEIGDKAGASPAVKASDSGMVRADEGFWVAVLPFKYSGSNSDLAALADGLTEEIVTGLSRFSYLKVISRSSTFRYVSESVDVRTAGKNLDARYVMEGSLRQAGTKLRLAVQLLDTISGAHLWAETYERDFSPESTFALQDDLVPRIVSTVADQNGVLTRRMSETLRSKSEDALTPHEAALRAFTYFERVTPEEHAVVRRILERAVRQAPDHADCWAMLSLMYSVEFADGFNPEPNPLERALAAAERAVHLASTHALGHYALAFVYFLRKETASFQAEAEKTLALNPMDGSVMGILGVLINCAGELERGCEMVEAAMQLNPNHSALFRWAAFTKAYAQGKYAEALELAVRINMPNYFYAYSARAAALGQLGQREAAKKELQQLLTLRPDFATAARREYAKWHDSDTVEHMIEGLRKAGLEIAGDS